MSNSNLHSAKRAKNDEFYTQYADIEKEMGAYIAHDPDVFRGQTLLLPCDDPEWSNFTKYFIDNFSRLGTKRLISTSFSPAGRGKILDYCSPGDRWRHLEGDGDFRSPEVTALRDEADMVITNPPFSLFRSYMEWLLAGKVKFAAIGNLNAITYKETFPLIKDNKMWLGASKVGATYQLPDSAELFHREINGKKYANVGTACWFTNIDHGKRPEPLTLLSMADNLRFNKYAKEHGYPKYDNYDAIEVGRVQAIPSDYTGVMGVPISFLSKYNPNQFEILGPAVVPAPLVCGKKKYARTLIKHKPQEKK